MLSRCFKEAGFETLAVDHKHNRFHPLAHICNVDLTRSHGWDFLMHILDHYPVSFIHAAPPCGTCSRAREIDLQGGGPPPLRSDAEPDGLSGITGEQLARVQSANDIYAGLEAFLLKATQLKIHWCIENPARSLLWSTTWMQSLQRIGSFYNFAACAWGSARPTDKSFLSTMLEMCQLQSPCPGGHVHAPYGRKRDSQGKYVYATAEEAAYPRKLALKIVEIVQHSLQLFPEPIAATPGNVTDNAAGHVSTAQQPRGHKMPPVISEFAATQTIFATDKPPVDAKNCLSRDWRGVPQFAKLLNLTESGEGISRRYKCDFGVFRSPLQWITEALSLEHPFDTYHAVSDAVLIALFETLTLGANEIARRRTATLRKWISMAKELETDEQELRSGMESGVKEVLHNKRVKLMEALATEMGWPDQELFTEMVAGFKLVGTQKPSYIFPLEPRPMAYSPQELNDAAKFLRPALLGKVRHSVTDTDSDLLWKMTCEEALNKHWMEGPLTVEQLNQRYPGGWIPVRRFGIWQTSGDKTKLRPIDDFAENRVNGSFGYSDKLNLRTLDQVVWICCTIARALKDGRVSFTLSDGKLLEGALHSSMRGDLGLPGLCILDLSNAYKQLPLHPHDRRYSITTLKDPASGEPACFEGKVLPFGATASVVHFNRCARFLQHVGLKLHIVWGNYFDDYPIISPACLQKSTMEAVTLLMKLLGFDYAQHKLKDFAPSAPVLGVEIKLEEIMDGFVAVTNKMSRIDEVCTAIDKIINEGKLTSREASRLLGRLQYADSFIMGREGRLVLTDLRNNIRSDGKPIVLTEEAVESLRLLERRLRSGKPRAVPWAREAKPVLVFTDGASEGEVHTIGGVLIDDKDVLYFGFHVPDPLVELWLSSAEHIIGMVELYAILVARVVWHDRLVSRKSLVFVDNNASKDAVVRGTSANYHFRKILLAVERSEAEGKSWMWIARVPSHSNPADEPSRGIFDNIIAKLGARFCEGVCPMTGEPLRVIGG